MKVLMKKRIMQFACKLNLIAGSILLLLCQQGFGQVEEQSMRYAVADSGVYVYHLEDVPLGVDFISTKKMKVRKSLNG